MSHSSFDMPAPRWNRLEVNRCLLPVLRYADGLRDDRLSQQELEMRKEQMQRSLGAHKEAYEQLSHVFYHAPSNTWQQWFGWIECDRDLLDEAFDTIDREMGTERSGASAQSYEAEMYFAAMFRITKGEQTIDLSHPFEQYYFCDPVMYHDHLFRRIEYGETCKAWIRRYLPYYNRIRAWYREHGEKKSGVGSVYDAYMELFDYFQSCISYEDGLRDERQALEYERAGLGWFHRDKKREIDQRLQEIAVLELQMKWEDAKQRYEAYEAQFAEQRMRWQEELACAPLTAFGRRRELKQQLAELEVRLEEYRAELSLDELQRSYYNMSKK